MEAAELALSKPELVETILSLVPVSDLVNCALVNWTWKEEAVKILNQKAIVKLNLDEHEISSYADMIRSSKGGRCHGRIVLDCLGRTRICHLRHSVTDEEFASVLSAIEVFGVSKIKRLMVRLEFGKGTRTPEDYQPIFAAGQNMESLMIRYVLWNGFAFSSTLSCFPEGISFPSLTTLTLVFTSGTVDEMNMIIGKLKEMSPNLKELYVAQELFA